MPVPGGRLRVVEVLRGLGLGGVEVSLLRRLPYSPRAVETIVVSTAPLLNALTPQVREVVRDVIELSSSDLSINRLPSFVSSLNPTVIVTHTPRETYKLLRSPLAAKSPVVPVVHHPYASEVRALRLPLASALTTVNHRAALHIAVSESAAMGEQCSRARRVEVAPLGAQLSEQAFPVEPWPPGTRIRLLAIGRLKSFKNFGGLIRAIEIEAPALQASGAHLVIVGSGPEEGSLRKQVTQGNLNELVTIIGEDSRAPALLRQADTFVITSIAEGGPITALEAALAGCRLVMTNVGLANDLHRRFPHYVTLITDPSPRSIASALKSEMLLGPVSPTDRAFLVNAASELTTAIAARRFYSLVGYASVG